MASLNDKQLRFVAEYLIDLNATQSAIRAGYSEKTARSIGQRLLTNVDIQNAISEAQSVRSIRTQITQDRVLQEFAKIGFSDIRSLFTEAGNLKPLSDLEADAAAALSSVEVVTKNLNDGGVEYVHKIKLWDKVGSLTQMGRHLGMFVDKTELRTVKKIEDMTDEELEAYAKYGDNEE
ncbi:terminase small subunit [Acetobacter thailandicus]|uniref:terminase small subunit n=1 Tax=Acetobacter thailandicus TaxID=1502842 RepID=UPI001BAA08E2|nr:terminase small subunit [Acetobacter thailandicus]MBS1003179.1 terminase small subunit [Acetobacter thailandicus]